MAHDREYETESHQAASARASSAALLAALTEHHDFNLPKPPLTFFEARKIRREEAQAIEIQHDDIVEPIEVCVLPIDNPRLTVSAIQRVVCLHFGISHGDLVSPRRTLELVRPRAVAMYLARELTQHGYPALGKFFKRDHTSVLHAVRNVELTIKRGDPISSEIQNLREMLTA